MQEAEAADSGEGGRVLPTASDTQGPVLRADGQAPDRRSSASPAQLLLRAPTA